MNRWPDEKPVLGFNIHPRWLQGGSAESFLMPLRAVGLRVLEFPLTLDAPDWPAMDALIEEALRLGFRISFHAPHKGPYTLVGFAEEDHASLKRLYRPALDYATRVAEENGPTPLVVHGAKGHRPRRELRRDTTAFLAWLLDAAPELRPALELRVREPGLAKIGDTKAGLVAVVSALNSPRGDGGPLQWRSPLRDCAYGTASRVGICWDLGHDARNGLEANPPGFAEHVTHVHVHDVSPDGEDHWPLVFGHVPYEEQLRRVRPRALILEVDGRLVARRAAQLDVPAHRLLRDSFESLNAVRSR